MEPCTRLRDDLKAYLDHELGFARRWKMRLHLARCARCAAEAQDMARISEELRQGDQVVLSDALRYRILAHAAEALPATQPGRRGAYLLRRPLAISGAAVAALLAVVISYRALLRSPEAIVNEARQSLASSTAPHGDAEKAFAADAAPGAGPPRRETMSAASEAIRSRTLAKSPSADRREPAATRRRDDTHGSPEAMSGGATKGVETPAVPPANRAPSVEHAAPARPGVAGAAPSATQEPAAESTRRAAAASNALRLQERKPESNVQVAQVLEMTLELEDMAAQLPAVEKLARAISGVDPGRDAVSDAEKKEQITYRILVPLEKAEQVVAGFRQLGRLAASGQADSTTAVSVRGGAAQSAELAPPEQAPSRVAAPPPASLSQAPDAAAKTQGERQQLNQAQPLGAPAGLSAPALNTATERQRTQPRPPTEPLKRIQPESRQTQTARDQQARAPKDRQRASKAGAQTAQQSPRRMALITVHVRQHSQRPAAGAAGSGGRQ